MYIIGQFIMCGRGGGLASVRVAVLSHRACHFSHETCHVPDCDDIPMSVSPAHFALRDLLVARIEFARGRQVGRRNSPRYVRILDARTGKLKKTTSCRDFGHSYPRPI